MEASVKYVEDKPGSGVKRDFLCVELGQLLESIGKNHKMEIFEAMGWDSELLEAVIGTLTNDYANPEIEMLREKFLSSVSGFYKAHIDALNREVERANARAYKANAEAWRVRHLMYELGWNSRISSEEKKARMGREGE